MTNLDYVAIKMNPIRLNGRFFPLLNLWPWEECFIQNYSIRNAFLQLRLVYFIWFDNNILHIYLYIFKYNYLNSMALWEFLLGFMIIHPDNIFILTWKLNLPLDIRWQSTCDFTVSDGNHWFIFISWYVPTNIPKRLSPKKTKTLYLDQSKFFAQICQIRTQALSLYSAASILVRSINQQKILK